MTNKIRFIFAQEESIARVIADALGATSRRSYDSFASVIGDDRNALMRAMQKASFDLKKLKLEENLDLAFWVKLSQADEDFYKDPLANMERYAVSVGIPLSNLPISGRAFDIISTEKIVPAIASFLADEIVIVVDNKAKVLRVAAKVENRKAYSEELELKLNDILKSSA